MASKRTIGIVGLPNVGKSTLFNALTKMSVPAENYPFCTIDPSVGVVPVPDARLDVLSRLSASAKTVPAVIEFVDIAGLVKGAAEGAGLGNQFLSHIREVDAILEVVRFFDDADVHHVEGEVEPYKDIEIINLELVLVDAEQVRKRRGTIQGDMKAGKKESIEEDAALAKLEQGFALGKLAIQTRLTDGEKARVKQLNLLTLKPILYALNRKCNGHTLDELKDGRAERAYELIENFGSTYVLVDAATERELNDVADEDRSGFRQELGVQEDGLAALIRGAYETLDLISFFTTGADESRAWTVPRGSTAPVAGAAIHEDFKDKFIRAEVISVEDLLSFGSPDAAGRGPDSERRAWAKAKELAKVRTEGKEYVVEDGDVMVFLHG